MADGDEQASRRGYHRLADLMSRHSETAIFRRFGELNALNLLVLQAELIDLQSQLHILQNDDEKQSTQEPTPNLYSVNIRSMIRATDSQQWEMLQIVRQKLKEYNEALLQVAQVSQIPSPGKLDIQFLREWLDGHNEGNGFLRGKEQFTWTLRDTSPKADAKFVDKELLALQVPDSEQDDFSRLMSSRLLRVWNWLITVLYSHAESESEDAQGPSDRDTRINKYQSEHLVRINNIIVSVIGATLPVVAIVALYYIRTEGGRLGALAGFTALFALALAVFTNARRLEIAASTAAFAAVEVVFIGSDLGKDNQIGS